MSPYEFGCFVGGDDIAPADAAEHAGWCPSRIRVAILIARELVLARLKGQILVENDQPENFASKMFEGNLLPVCRRDWLGTTTQKISCSFCSGIARW